MPLLRLAYSTQFLLAVIAIYVAWSEVGGQGHLDLMPWYLKLGLGVGGALAFVKATAAAVSREHAWNGRTLKWAGILLALLVACGVTTLYVHLYEEDQSDEEEPNVTSLTASPRMMERDVYPAIGVRGSGHVRVRADICRLDRARRRH